MFRDDLGEFSRIRHDIACCMPEDVRRKKLAARLALMAQSGQYNYARCLAHDEDGAAMLAVSEFVKNTAEAVFLLNRRHAPYYKWLLRGMRGLENLGELSDALEFLLTGDNDEDGKALKSQVIEDICAQIVSSCARRDLAAAAGTISKSTPLTCKAILKTPPYARCTSWRAEKNLEANASRFFIIVRDS